MMDYCKTGIPSRLDIIKASMDDPVLHQALEYWRAGSVTFEQAMMVAVLFMSEQRLTHQEVLRKAAEAAHPTYVIDGKEYRQKEQA